MMNRRAFLNTVGGSLLIAPFATRAQQAGTVYRIGVLSYGGGSEPLPMEAFKRGLRELGYIEGKHFVVDTLRPATQDGLPAAAVDLVRRRPDVIVAMATQSALAARQATRSIPIVMASSADPVLGGAVQSLAQPGSNVTGLSLATPDVTAKRLQLLREMVPGMRRVAAVYHGPLTPGRAEWIRENETAGKALGLDVQAVDATQDPLKWDEVFARLPRSGVNGVTQREASVFLSYRDRVAELTLKHRLPAIFPGREYCEAGGLMSYGGDIKDLGLRTAVYVDRILRGAKPADLPVEQPTKFELVINLKTAKALGLTIPQSVFLRADEVIQ